jgi:hypothetical protein
MDGPASVPLPIATCGQSGFALSEGTHYVKDPINTTQHGIVCWIDEEGRYEMDLGVNVPRWVTGFLFITVCLLGTHVPV